MPDETVLNIVLKASGALGSGNGGYGAGPPPAGNGSPPPPQNGVARGGSAGNWDPDAEARRRIVSEGRARQVDDAYRQILGVPPSASINSWSPGMAPPPIQVKPGGTAGRAPSSSSAGVAPDSSRPDTLLQSLGVAAAAVGFFTQAVQAATAYFRGEIAAKGQEIGDNDALGARISRRRNTTSFLGNAVGIAAGAAGAVGGFFIGGPWGAAAGGAGGFAAGKGAVNALGDIAGRGDEENQGALGYYGQRLGRLGRYGGPLASAFARQRVAGERRNFAEAAALGPEGARFIDLETRHDTLSQELAFIKAMKDLPEARQKLEQENAKVNRDIRDATRDMTELQRKMLEQFRKGGKTPLDQILERQPDAPDDRRREWHDDLAGALAQVLNQPVFGGR